MEKLKTIDIDAVEEIAKLSQHGCQYENPTVLLRRMKEDASDGSYKADDVVLTEDTGNQTTYYLLDSDESKEALSDPKKYLEGVANDWASNTDDYDLERYLWGIADPSDDEVADDYTGSVKIVCERQFYGPYYPTSYISDEDSGDVIIFETVEDAQEWVDDKHNSNYYLAHNESGCPSYTIVPN